MGRLLELMKVDILWGEIKYYPMLETAVGQDSHGQKEIYWVNPENGNYYKRVLSLDRYIDCHIKHSR